MNTFIVGLTGGIGSGKTTVSDLFNALGITIVDADVIAREVVAPGSDGLRAIVTRFGDTILDALGHLDRAKLRTIVFSQEREKQWLNGLLHPLIREQMVAQCHAAKSPYVILSVPLLIENNLQTMVNRTLVVDVSRESQIQRTANRDGVGVEQIESILASQCDRETRLQAADDVISNEGDVSSLNEQVADLHEKYLTLAQM
ncbi:MAG: dephospho-CoA kinase [Alteromonadaceae bacterium]|nr:dephospho-CoA kinase [Alteromonadaceae bacterium]